VVIVMAHRVPMSYQHDTAQRRHLGDTLAERGKYRHPSTKYRKTYPDYCVLFCPAIIRNRAVQRETGTKKARRGLREEKTAFQEEEIRKA